MLPCTTRLSAVKWAYHVGAIPRRIIRRVITKNATHCQKWRFEERTAKAKLLQQVRVGIANSVRKEKEKLRDEKFQYEYEPQMKFAEKLSDALDGSTIAKGVASKVEETCDKVQCLASNANAAVIKNVKDIGNCVQSIENTNVKAQCTLEGLDSVLEKCGGFISKVTDKVQSIGKNLEKVFDVDYKVFIPILLVPIGLALLAAMIVSKLKCTGHFKKLFQSDVWEMLCNIANGLITTLIVSSSMVCAGKLWTDREVIMEYFKQMFEDENEQVYSVINSGETVFEQDDPADYKERMMQAINSDEFFLTGESESGRIMSEGFWRGLSAIISTGVGAWVTKDTPTKSTVQRIANTLNATARYHGIFHSMLDLVRFCSHFLPGCVKEWLYTAFGCYPGMILDKENISCWWKKCIAIIEKVNTLGQVFYRKKENRDEVSSLFYESLDIQSELRWLLPTTTEMNLLRNLFTTLDNMNKQRLAYEGIAPVRQKPTVVHISGETSIGKTDFVHYLINAVYPEEEVRDVFYTKNTQDAFWTAYANQEVVVIDDYLAVTDDPTSVDLMQMVSSLKYMPNMPSLSNDSCGKKGTAFTSKLIVITTNQPPQAPPKNISCLEAYRSRLHVCVKAVVKQHFKVGGSFSPDVLKTYRQRNQDEENPCPHLNFHLLNAMNGERLNNVDYEFADVVNMVKNCMTAFEKDMLLIARDTATPHETSAGERYQSWYTTREAQLGAKKGAIHKLLSEGIATIVGRTYEGLRWLDVQAADFIDLLYDSIKQKWKGSLFPLLMILSQSEK